MSDALQDSHMKAKSQEQVLQLFLCAPASTSKLKRQSICRSSPEEPAPGLGAKRTSTGLQTNVGVDYIKKQIYPVACRGCRRADHIELASDSVHPDVAGISPAPGSMP